MIDQGLWDRLRAPLDKRDKLKLSESDICELFISPAIKEANWDPLTQIRREVTLTPGPVVVRGNLSSRNKKKKKFADYVLSWKPALPIAVVEAKDNTFSTSHGLQQALGYADILQIPSAFSSNGDGFASHNKCAGPDEDIEREFGLEQFPTPGRFMETLQSFSFYRRRSSFLGRVTVSY
jgi:type I restriction enzyme, R subunit